MIMNRLINKVYYTVRPLIPRRLQLMIRRMQINRIRKNNLGIWPINPNTRTAPLWWSSWPEGKQFALILTHDVETNIGHDRCRELAELEKNLGFRSAFYFVPERYEVLADLRKYLVHEGFEVGIHGLKHDGKLYLSRKIFLKRAKRINHYIKEWQAEGFRSPAMHRNLDWIHDLNIKYDLSTFDTDPFVPQPDGVNTIFPSVVKNNKSQYVEMPYTLSQDSTLFLMLEEKNIEIWKKKLDWIVERGGMALTITHPDYMDFQNKNKKMNEYPVKLYKEFLEYISTEYRNQFWNVLPRELTTFWINFEQAKKRNDQSW